MTETGKFAPACRPPHYVVSFTSQRTAGDRVAKLERACSRKDGRSAALASADALE